MIARLISVPVAVVAVLLSVLVSVQGTAWIPPALSAAEGRRIEILFLGHNSTHHDSGRFAPMLKAALAPDGFNFSYTTDPAALNAANLAKYDALMIYANHTKIAPEQEKALLDFVAGGKAFLPIHSASFCFQNSEPYIALVGAQFQKHGTGEFTAEITQPNHPVMAGMKPFQVWDETYVHTKINPDDRTVLMERVDAAGREPWTWVRTHGKGRVFYTAYGHDERVWNNPNFHLLIKNALLWAVGPETVAQFSALEPPAAEVHRLHVPVPNYERRATAPRLQEALSTRRVRQAHADSAGLRAQLFASEPMHPGQPRSDGVGREAAGSGLPRRRTTRTTMQPAGQGRDVIRILEDTNRDGQADKSTIFADKLSIVSSLVFVNGGIIVAQGGEFTFLKDTNGDDKADVREIDHHRLGRARHARARVEPEVRARQLAVGRRRLLGLPRHRRRPGRGLSTRRSIASRRRQEDGAHGQLHQQHLGPRVHRELRRVRLDRQRRAQRVRRDPAAPVLPGRRRASARDGKKKIDGHYAMQANTQKIRQVDVAGRLHRRGGPQLLHGARVPGGVLEPHRVRERADRARHSPCDHRAEGLRLRGERRLEPRRERRRVDRAGARRGRPRRRGVVRSTSTTSSSSTTRRRRDRSPGLSRTRTDAATPTTRRCASTPARPHLPPRRGRAPSRTRRCRSAPTVRPSSCAALSNDNMFWRTTAQRLLVERGKADVLPQLIALVNDRTVDKIGLNSPAVHALWTMHGLGVLDGSQRAARSTRRSAR